MAGWSICSVGCCIGIVEGRERTAQPRLAVSEIATSRSACWNVVFVLHRPRGPAPLCSRPVHARRQFCLVLLLFVLVLSLPVCADDPPVSLCSSGVPCLYKGGSVNQECTRCLWVQRCVLYVLTTFQMHTICGCHPTRHFRKHAYKLDGMRATRYAKS